MDAKKQDSGKSVSGSSTFLIKFYADSDELQVEEISKSSISASDKCEEEESPTSSDSISTCSTPVSSHDANPSSHNRDASPIKDYLSRFKRSISVDTCTPEQAAAGGDAQEKRNFFSDFKGRITKRVEDKFEEIRNDRFLKLNKASKDSSFSDVDSDILSPELSPTVKTSTNLLSNSCSDINATDEKKSAMVFVDSLDISKIEKLSTYLDFKLSNQEAIKNSKMSNDEKSSEKKPAVPTKSEEKNSSSSNKGSKKHFKKTRSELNKLDPIFKSYFQNRKNAYLNQGVVEAEKVEEAEEAEIHHKLNEPETSHQNLQAESNTAVPRKMGPGESLFLFVNWWKAFFGLTFLSLIHLNMSPLVTAFFAGLLLSLELKNVMDFLLQKCGFQSASCGDDLMFYKSFLQEQGASILGDSAIFNSPPEKVIHQDWMNELLLEYNPDWFHLSLTESVYIHLDGPLLYVSSPRFKIPKRAVWSEPQYKMLFNEKRMYLITNCVVDLVPEGLIRKRKWSRKFPIRIKLLPHSFIGACIRGSRQPTIDDKAEWVPANEYVPRTHSDFSLVLPGDTQSDSIINEESNKTSKVPSTAANSSSIKNGGENQKSTSGKPFEESVVTRHQLDRNERYFKTHSDKQPSKSLEKRPLNTSEKQTLQRSVDKLDKISDKESPKLSKGRLKSASADNILSKVEEEVLSTEFLDDSDISLVSALDRPIRSNDPLFDVRVMSVSQDSTEEEDTSDSQSKYVKSKVCGKKRIVLSEREETEVILKNKNEPPLPSIQKLIEHQKEESNVEEEELNVKEEEKYLYLFCRTNRQKEEWFNYLSAATKFKVSHGEIKTEETDYPKDQDDPKISSDVPYVARKSKYLYYMYNLQQSFVPKTHPDISLPKDVTNDSEVEIQLLWLNTLLGRLTHEFSKNPVILNLIKKKIQQKIGLITLPRFMDALHVSNLEIDDVYPIVRRAGRPVLDERGIWVDLDVVYNGSSKIAIDTKLNLLKLKRSNPKTTMSASFSNLTGSELLSSPEKQPESSPRRSAAFHSDVESESSENTSDEEPVVELGINEDSVKSENSAAAKQRSQMKTGQKVLKFVDKFTSTKIFESFIENKYVKKVVQNVSNTDLSLIVELKWLCGTLVINIPPPPADRIWIGFRGNPKMVLSCYPRFGETAVSYMEVSKWIRKLLIREMEKNLVLPNMEDLLLPNELLQR